MSLLASDFPRAKAFVADRLGELGANAEPLARLRETVLAFHVANGSNSRVAKDMYIHENTIAYRIKRAEELLGRPLVEDSRSRSGSDPPCWPTPSPIGPTPR